MTTESGAILGVVLAGGLSRRMGGTEKSLMVLAGRPLVAHIRDRLAPQVDRLILNANGDPARFAGLGLPIQADTVGGNAGPLAGILAGMRWARRNAPSLRFIATAATDTPFFPLDLVARLADATHLDQDCIGLACSAGHRHPVFGLWPVALADDLEDFLTAGETGKVMRFVDRHRLVEVDFPFDASGGREADPFFNVNTPEEFEIARRFAEPVEHDR